MPKTCRLLGSLSAGLMAGGAAGALVTAMLLPSRPPVPEAGPADGGPGWAAPGGAADGPLAAKLDEYLTAAVKADQFSGAVLVAKGEEPAFSRGYGMASYELGVPNTPATVFPIASLTKPFTAAAVLLLQERGKLNVNDPVGKYLDRCPAAWQPVTVRHLLTHTSGITNFTDFPGYVTNAALATTDEEVVARFRDKPLEFAPGERYKYSNSGYYLLGMVVEKVSGRSYGEYLAEHVFRPLGMRDTGVAAKRQVLKGRAQGYDLADGALVTAVPQDVSHIRAIGGITSTTGDLLIWARALDTDRILSAQSRAAAFTPFKGTYGYGWNVTTSSGRREVRHSGRNFGYSSHLKWFPDDRAAVIVLSNNQAADAPQVAADMAAILFGAPYRVPRVAVPVPPAVVARYAGRYEVSPEVAVTVTAEGGRLFAQGTGQGKAELVAGSETSFHVKNTDARVEFHTDDRGTVTALTMMKGGRETKASRVGP